ncbi:DUF1045 domain-containing protein [Rhizobium paknamense]|uniref:Phosphonate metabolism protein n=1 Tax=Rhizobium paknamense TaxID=1206817 RepID=A0ABU0IDQ2_9HYPH|nr:DUF1045 domain-containing protein [Rhizobium paknamense]MDQ0455376.1 putative phosphonate metabolism protein [Rhizobium paknamense]
MRYALYFTPPADDVLTMAAARWLGRDAFAGNTLPQPEIPGFSPEEFAALTADPRRYGFHATLKAPFALREGRTEEALLDAFAEFCANNAPLTVPSVRVDQLGPFFALVPSALYADLQTFAARIVEAFDPFRAPLSEADRARRKPERLSETERALLDRWGYPYVMDAFRFHMTLTGPVPEAQAPAMAAATSKAFHPFIDRPLEISGLGLFQEPSPGAAFTLHTWLPLQGKRG